MIYSILCLFLLFISPKANATDKVTYKKLKLGLSDAVDLALRKSPLLDEGQARIKESESNYLDTLSAVLPEISGEVSQSRSVINLKAEGLTSIFPSDSGSNNLPDFSSVEKVGPYNTFDARVSIDEIVLDIESLYNIKAGKKEVSASRNAYRNTVQKVKTDTVAAYINVLRAIADVNRTNADLQTSDALYKQAKDLFNNGISTGVDVKRAKVQYLNSKQVYLEAKNSLDVAIKFLTITMGIDPSRDIELTDKLEYSELVDGSEDTLLSYSFDHRPDLKSLRDSKKELKYKIKSAEFTYAPKLGLHADYGASGVTPDESVIPTWTVQAFLKFPIFSGGSNVAKIKRSKSRLVQVDAQIEDLKNQIKYDVQSSLLQLDSAKNQIEVARSGIELARESLQQSRDRFKEGLTNNIEVITSQDELVRAEENLVKALYKYNIARVSLARAVGDISYVYKF